MLILRKPLDSQPQEVRPLSQEFRFDFGWHGAYPAIDLVTGKPFTRASGLTDIVGLPGRGVTIAPNATAAFSTPAGIDSTHQQITFVCVFTWQSGSQNFPQLAGDSTQNVGFRLGSSSAGGGNVGIVKGGVASLSTITLTSDVAYALVASHNTVTGEAYIIARPVGGGTLLRAADTSTSATVYSNNTWSVGIARTDFSGSWRGNVFLSAGGHFFLPETRARELVDNPWEVFEPRRIIIPIGAATAGTHAATGSLVAQAATVAGTAADVATYTSTGALTAQAAAVAGTATHLTLHASTGALAAQAAVVAGTAEHTAPGSFSATGALTAQAAAVAGSAVHLTLHTATGALASGSATAAGAAVHYTLHTAAGDLVADAASISGSALHEGDGAEVAKPFTGAGRPRRTRQRVVVEIDGEDFIAESSEEAQAILDQAKEAAEEKAKVAVERATKARNRPTRKVMADARKALELPAISAPDLGGYAEEISRQIEDIYQSAIQTIEVAALLRKRELEEEDDEDILMLL